MSFPRSGSGFREVAAVGGRAACLPAPAHLLLPAALSFCTGPRPPTRAECQAVRVAGAAAPPGTRGPPAREPPELQLGAEAGQSSAGAAAGRGHAPALEQAGHLAPRRAWGRQRRGAASPPRYGCRPPPWPLGVCRQGPGGGVGSTGASTGGPHPGGWSLWERVLGLAGGQPRICTTPLWDLSGRAFWGAFL